ncbi:MAG: Ig-like domain-containing protein [Candidatus Acetothermia bacterium]|nr:Ig-like domain-containing protein [Candidatus Acetothermia bacterium]
MMRRVGSWVGGLILVLGGIAVGAPPMATDLFVTTLRDTPVEVVLEAADAGVDCAHPEQHPLTFTIMSAPSQGTLDGDLARVIYADPNLARVRLVYTPKPGFVGTDTFVYSVTDPFGFFATAVVRIDVTRPPALPPTLSGVWELGVTFRNTAPVVSLSKAALTLFYKYDVFSLEASATWTDTGWTALAFVVGFPLGTAATVRSVLAFDPTGPSFTYWQTDTRFRLFELDLTHTVYLTGDPSTTYTQVAIQGAVDDLSFTSTTKFRIDPLEFVEETLTTRWTWADCDLTFAGRLRMTKEGFDRFSVTAGDVAIPGFQYPSLGLYFRVEVGFTTQTKEVVPTLVIKSDWVCCVRLLTNVVTEDTTISGIAFYGFEMRTELEGGVEVRTATSFVDEKNAAVTGYCDYFEVWWFSGPILPCCGSPGRWQIGTYFDDRGRLFGWGMTRIVLDFALGDSVRVSTEFSVFDSNWEWKVGIKVRW